ncbi:MAG: hypothetical protein ACREN8_13735 [Candidatus Dormibacteraceae bacterium]
MAIAHEEFTEPIDPIDAAIARDLADPKFRERLRKFKERDAKGEIQWVSHEEALRQLSQLPLP